MIIILRQTHPVATHVSSVEMKNSHTEALDASYFSLNICDGRHHSDRRFAADYNGIPVSTISELTR